MEKIETTYRLPEGISAAIDAFEDIGEEKFKEIYSAEKGWMDE